MVGTATLRSTAQAQLSQFHVLTMSSTEPPMSGEALALRMLSHGTEPLSSNRKPVVSPVPAHREAWHLGGPEQARRGGRFSGLITCGP